MDIVQGSCYLLGYYQRGLIKTQEGQPHRNEVVKKTGVFLCNSRVQHQILQNSSLQLSHLCFFARALKFPTHCFPGGALAGLLSTFLRVPGALPSYSQGLCPASWKIHGVFLPADGQSDALTVLSTHCTTEVHMCLSILCPAKCCSPLHSG